MSAMRGQRLQNGVAGATATSASISSAYPYGSLADRVALIERAVRVCP
jgi:hypothetical protein